MAAGRRRTDVPDELWRGPAEVSAHPNARGRERSDGAPRRPVTPTPASADGARQLSRSRLPLPPVPAPARSYARPAAAAAPPCPAPQTTAAPFQAVPSPEPRADVLVDDVRPLPMAARPASAPAAPLVERRKRPRTVTPAPERPRSTWHQAESALGSTGGSLGSTGGSGLRSSGSAPRLPMQTTSAGSSAPAYGDWTKPSRADDAAGMAVPLPAEPDAFAVAPSTTAIPERSLFRGRRGGAVPADRFDAAAHDAAAYDAAAYDPADEWDHDRAPAAVRGPGTGPVGGRAAQRAERQAADAVRRKAQKQRGSAVDVLEAEEQAGRPRRVVKGLVAMTVVALGVLGVYTAVSPETADIAATSPATSSSAPTVAPPTDTLPELPTAPLDVEPIVAAPVKAPVTVLNSTGITGLAAKIAETVVAGGWESPGVGAYTADDITASTVYFTDGDENQEQAAQQLKEQFPQLAGPAPRFFELPADVVAPGLVVVATGDWQP